MIGLLRPQDSWEEYGKGKEDANNESDSPKDSKEVDKGWDDYDNDGNESNETIHRIRPRLESSTFLVLGIRPRSIAYMTFSYSTINLGSLEDYSNAQDVCGGLMDH